MSTETKIREHHWQVIEREPDVWCVAQMDEDGARHSLGCGRGPESRVKAEARFAELAEDGACSECEDLLAPTLWMDSVAAEIRARRLCHGCLFWTKLAEDRGDPARVVADGTHYTIAPALPKGRDSWHAGFGGARFDIRFHDGREVTTHNLWRQGRVPARFRDRLPDNAAFVRLESRQWRGYTPGGSA